MLIAVSHITAMQVFLKFPRHRDISFQGVQVVVLAVLPFTTIDAGHRCMYMPVVTMTFPYRSFARHRYLRNTMAFK